MELELVVVDPPQRWHREHVPLDQELCEIDQVVVVAEGVDGCLQLLLSASTHASGPDMPGPHLRPELTSSLAASSLSASSCSSCSSSVVSSACPRKWIRHCLAQMPCQIQDILHANSRDRTAVTWRLSFSSLPRSSSSFLTCCSMSPCDSAISSRLYGCGWSVLRSLTFSCAAAVPRHATRFWKKQRFCWILCSIPQ
eukprot:313661-Rhodomonas_salina.1